MNIVTEYPFWFIIFCLFLGLLYSVILYYKNKKYDLAKWYILLMAVLRFVSISLIAFLLLSPLLKTVFKYIEKPIIILAQDNSQSIVINKDSSFYKNEYIVKLKDLKSKLSKDYDVKTYSFGDKIGNNLSNTYSERQTDISMLFNELQTRYSDRNVGAIVLASDGIYNKGANPVYASQNIKFPVYTIALGDTNAQKDIILSKINYNRIAYLNNKFFLEIIVNANKCKGNKSRLTVSKDKKILFSKNINFTDNLFTETDLIQLEAKKTGLQHYKVSLSKIKNEISYANNTQDIFIDILNSKQKILILANSPNPDVAALKEAIENNYNDKVEDFVIDDFNKAISKYNLVILHQLPSLRHPCIKLISKLIKSKTPILYIIGSQTNLDIFNTLKTGLIIKINKTSYDEALPVINNNFTLFTISKDLQKLNNELPPLISPFGNYKTFSSANVLYYQKIGIVPTEKPLILFNQNLDSKTAVIAGEGIWKWRLTDYVQENNHNAFNELVNKIVQYLSVKENKSFFRIISKNNFIENQAVEFDAEVYNQSYELINKPDVKLTIINSDNKTFPFVFSKTHNNYHLNAGYFPIGNYKYKARVKVGDKLLQNKGEFTVSDLNIEKVNSVAEHNLMYKLAKNHDGAMVYPNHIADLYKKIKNREDIKTVSYSQKRYKDLINIKWLFFIILAFLSAEWFLRKRGGTY